MRKKVMEELRALEIMLPQMSDEEVDILRQGLEGLMVIIWGEPERDERLN